MKTEISKGTQKFIWHIAIFAAVFILALVIICRVLPESNRTASPNQSTQISTSQTEEILATDFDSLKERVDQTNNSTGKEIKNLYSGEGKSTMQKQLETRLFFNTLKSILICVLLVLVVIVLIKKGLNIKSLKKLFGDDEKTPDTDQTKEKAKAEDSGKEIPVQEDAPRNLTDSQEHSEDDTSDDEEPPIVDPVDPDELEVAENCKL